MLGLFKAIVEFQSRANEASGACGCEDGVAALIVPQAPLADGESPIGAAYDRSEQGLLLEGGLDRQLEALMTSQLSLIELVEALQ